MKKKTIALLLALALVFGGAVGGTIAWLTATSDTVTNTFTTSDISVTLTEIKTDFKMIPGHTIEKDPKVTVTKGSEDCYLFVKIEKSEKLDTYITYTVAEGWEQLTDGDGKPIAGVYYREVKKDAAKDQVFSVLKDDKVSVKDTVTKKQMEEAETNKPTLTFTAYASQLYKSAGVEFTAKEAWENAQPAT